MSNKTFIRFVLCTLLCTYVSACGSDDNSFDEEILNNNLISTETGNAFVELSLVIDDDLVEADQQKFSVSSNSLIECKTIDLEKLGYKELEIGVRVKAFGREEAQEIPGKSLYFGDLDIRRAEISCYLQYQTHDSVIEVESYIAYLTEIYKPNGHGSLGPKLEGL